MIIPPDIALNPWPEVEIRFPNHPIVANGALWDYIYTQIGSKRFQNGVGADIDIWFYTQQGGEWRPAKFHAGSDYYPVNATPTPFYTQFDAEGNPIGDPDYWWIKLHVNPDIMALLEDPPGPMKNAIAKLTWTYLP